MENVTGGLYEEIRKHSKLAVYQEGEYIYTPGDPSDSLYLIVEGKVKLSYPGENGRGLTLVVLGANEIFGEMALTGARRRELVAEVLERSSLYAIDKERFFSLIEGKAGVFVQLIKLLVLRIRRVEERLGELILGHPATKLSLMLLQLAQEYSEKGGNGNNASLKITDQDLAELMRVAAVQDTVATPALQREES